jgi:hypothetical protein
LDQRVVEGYWRVWMVVGMIGAGQMGGVEVVPLAEQGKVTIKGMKSGYHLVVSFVVWILQNYTTLVLDGLIVQDLGTETYAGKNRGVSPRSRPTLRWTVLGASLLCRVAAAPSEARPRGDEVGKCSGLEVAGTGNRAR